MEFRWVALIALWTVISGPVIGVPTGPASSRRTAETKAVKPLLPRMAPR